MKQVVIIGGGPAGIEAASSLSKKGHKVYLIEKNDRLGGHLNDWDRLFPTGESAKKVLDFLLASLNNRAEVFLNTEVQYCQKENQGFALVLNNNHTLKADAILVCSGFDLFEAQRKEEYGYGIYDNVITSFDLEQKFKTNNVRCADGRIPQRIAFVHCVGSRDEKTNNTYCSKVCCVTAVKQACEIKELYPQANVFNLYMDLRMFDRHFEDMYHQAQSKYGVQFIRGRLSETAINSEGKIVIKTEDTLMGKPLKTTIDLLVLMAGMEACKSSELLSKKFGIEKAEDHFFRTKNLYTENNFSKAEGIFLAGCGTGPKSIPETLADARAAADQVHFFFMK